VSIDPQQLVHTVVNDIHSIGFHLDDGGRASPEFVRGFFSTDFLPATSDIHRLIVDLTGVISLDSSALGPLVQKLRDTQERNGAMALAGVNAPALREIFALTRFDKVFRMFATRDEALKALQQTA
jgi:anti-anti-sigma factor